MDLKLKPPLVAVLLWLCLNKSKHKLSQFLKGVRWQRSNLSLVIICDF